MRFRPSAVLPGLLLLLASAASGAERHELENGLVVLLRPQRSAPAVAVGAFVRCGRAHEPAELAGVSHFVEHMLFRATERDPHGRSEREAWAEGARVQAATLEDFTRVSVLLPSHRLSLAVDLLAGALTGARFQPEEVEEERQVILEEIRIRAGNAELSAFEELSAMAYLPHPYGGRLAGTATTIENISHDRLRAWFFAGYRPDRTVVVVTGDFEEEQALAEVKRGFAEWSVPPAAFPGVPPLPSAFGHYQEQVLFDPGASPLLLLAFGMPARDDPSYVASRFFAELLEGWISRRLVERSGRAIATNVFYARTFSRNLLRIRVTLTEPADAAPARDELLSLLAEIREPGFTFTGVERVAAHYRAREILQLESLHGFVEELGRAVLTGYYAPDGVPAHLAAPDRYRRIDPAAVSAVARHVLDPANFRVLFLLPPGTSIPPSPAPSLVRAASGGFPVDEAPIRMEPPPDREGHVRSPPLSDSSASRLELPSGGTLLHLERPSLPLVSVAVVLPAGSGDDPPGKEGLALLTARTLLRSTEGRLEDALRWQVYGLGNQIEVSVGPATTRILFTVPRDGLPEALAVVGEMLHSPAFGTSAIEAARGRLRATAREQRDRISPFARNAFRRLVLGGGPGTGPVCGTGESLARIERDDVIRFYREHLGPEKAIIAVVGDVARRRATSLVVDALARMSRERIATPPRSPAPDPILAAAGPLRLTHPSGRGQVLVGGRAPAAGHPDQAVAEVLALALGWQVFVEFTERRSDAYEAGAFYEAHADGGLLGAFVGAPAEKVEEAAEVLEGILSRAAAEGIPKELVEDAKGAWLGSLAVSGGRTAAIAERMAWQEAIGLSAGWTVELAGEVAKVTPAEVRELAAKLFAEEKFLTVLVGR